MNMYAMECVWYACVCQASAPAAPLDACEGVNSRAAAARAPRMSLTYTRLTGEPVCVPPPPLRSFQV